MIEILISVASILFELLMMYIDMVCAVTAIYFIFGRACKKEGRKYSNAVDAPIYEYSLYLYIFMFAAVIIVDYIK